MPDLAEIIYKIGDQPGPDIRQTWLDGMVMEIQESGILIPPSEITAFWNDQTDPTEFSLLAKGERRDVRKRLRSVAYYTEVGRTAQEVADRLYPNAFGVHTAQTLADAQTEIDRGWEDRTAFLADGYDTAWSRDDLRGFGVILADLTQRELRRMFRLRSGHARPINDEETPEIAPPTPLRRSRFRFDYQTFFNPAFILKLQDPERRVEVPGVVGVVRDYTTATHPKQNKKITPAVMTDFEEIVVP